MSQPMEPVERDSAVESPHFRPAPFADVTNDGQFALESPGPMAKKRKSLGRRVSFAAKAKVRFIENESDNEGEAQEEIGAMNEIDGEKSEKTSKEEEDNIFLVAKPPMVKAERPPASNLESEGSSIEVELRDPRSSFSSYDSVDENVTERPFLLDDMEMTGCVGGIIQANGEHRDENQTMDLTSCLGGILQNLPRASTSPSVLESIPPVSPSSVDTMELTRVVGGIIGGLVRTDESPMAVEHHSARHEGEKSKGARHEDKHHEKNTDDKEMDKMKSDLSHVEMDMDEAQTMKPPTTTLQMKKTNNATPPRGSTSPSPFLVETPLNSEMSFIGDMAAPRSLGCGASPAPSRRSQDVLEEMDLTTELFNKYIDTSRFNSLTLHGANDDDVVKRETDEFNRVTQPMEMAVGTPRVTAVLPSSQAESPTVTLILPRASLRDFLNDTGIRFLDNLSSLTRRETTGRPRESELVSAGRQLFVDCGLSLESDAMDEACVELASHIHAVRDELQRQEEHFNHSPPLAFLQYRDPQERLAVISKLKTLKSIARLCAKHAWYEWRQPVHARLNAALAANAALLSPRLVHLSALTGRLDEMRTAVEPKLVILEAELHALQVRSERLPSGPDDGERAVHLEASLATQTARQASIDEEMARLVRREQELRTSIDRALGRRHELQQSVTHLRSHVDATPEISPLILADLRSTLELLQGVSGWKLMRVSPNAISLRYPRADLGVTLLLASNLNHLVVRDVSFDVASVQSRLIKHAPRLIRTDPELSPAQCVFAIGRGLDRLALLDRQLAIVSVQCTVSIPPPETISSPTSALPIALGFLHAPTRAKFDLLFTIEALADGPTLLYSQFVHFAGHIQEQHVRDAVHLSLTHRFQPVRRLVAAVSDILDSREG